MKHYSSIQRGLVTTVWALNPPYMDLLVGIIDERLRLGKPPDDVIVARASSVSYGTRSPPRQKHIAVIPLHGVIAPRADLFTEASGGTTSQGFAAMVREAADNDDIESILLDVDSPGGAVANIDTAVEAVRYARSQKRIEAFTSGMMASAAYWISSQADKITLAPNAHVGSVGVIATHFDETERAASEGVKVTYIRSADQKALGQPYESIDEKTIASIQAELQTHHQLFVEGVASGRGMQADDVQERFGDGRVHIGLGAVEIGMADEVGSIESVLESMGTKGVYQVSKPVEPIEATAPQRDVMAEVGQILKIEGCNSAKLQEYADMREQLETEAKDGRAYRASLLEQVGALNIATRNDEATAERMKRLFAGADITDIAAEVTRLEGVRDAAFPAGRVSVEGADTPVSDESTSSNQVQHDWSR
ncbi:MAG: S49 family peptidase [Deinococcota bacterium]